MSSRQIGEILAALIEAVESIKRRLDDPRAAVVEDIASLVAEAMSKLEIPPGAPGEPGRPPTPSEIQRAVDIWVELNQDKLRGAPGLRGLRGLQGLAGRDATYQQVYDAVQQWMDAHRDTLKGATGDKGDQGVGIERVEQRTSGSFWIVLTNGEEYEVKLPRGGSGGGGGAVGATFRTEVYLNEQPALNFPAISFTEVVGYPGLYLEAVNVP